MFQNGGERDKDNETDLMEKGGIEIRNTVLHSRAAPFVYALYLLTIL